ncbi:MAG: hypothetical protein JNK87_10835 [Bryobacterales bacterium]|nr:hypothetical protein [Bryobacterales bacterium]
MIAFLGGEPGAEILMDAESRCYARALNVCERAGSREREMQAVADLTKMNVVEEADLALAIWQAPGSLKGSSTAGLPGLLLCDHPVTAGV